MRLQLKFRTGTSSAKRRSVIAKAARAGAAVRPLFPAEKDEELASLYVVDIDNPKRHDAILALLSAEKYVEFVEDEVARKLKHPAPAPKTRIA